MINYTDRLKSYWKSNDLIFIATFKKTRNNGGYFNHFINPVSKMKLFYPSFDEIEILDKRVSFYFNNSKDFIDGDFYKVELEYTDNPDGKNNPYSLSIKSIVELNQSKINVLLEKSLSENSSDIKYIGQYHKSNDKFASFDYVMCSETGDILISRGESQQVFVSPNIDLLEGHYYSFYIKENEGMLPNAILNTITKIALNPYQEYIRLRFERLNNPEANKMIANLMREIGKGMYSSKQRMIFELLQNADDAPGKEKVEFHIDINGDYFFIMHDGAPFNKDDVEAITSAAESTKKNDNKKTGYKGIGFKSVFTDSTEVWLKSGGYQFAFIRNNPIFENFDKFYFSSDRYKKYPELLTEDKLKFRNQRLKFNGSTDIPWQVIPIWQDHLPIEFNDSNFNNFNNPVQFALKLGKNNIEEYKLAIDNIAKRPQFLLFLRNTSKFNSPRNGILVLRNDIEEIIEIIKLKGNEKEIFHYTKQMFGNIEVSDEAFSELNIGLKKQSRINDYNEVSYYFTDLEGVEIETIPPKLASATETEISFGISLVKNKISPEKEYLEEAPKYSSLFTYLPMEDTRFQLPFLINADFVPSSDRQDIQGDNLWNKYIMIKAAEKHVATLEFYAEKFIENNNSFGSYLSLLLRELIPEDDTAQQIINSYNEKYLEQLNTQPIIVNDKNQVQLLSETIIDASGLVELFGHEIFYEIIETEKHLPHYNLDAIYLEEYDYLQIEIIDLKELATHITPKICVALGEIIAENILYKKTELLKWLNQLVKHIPENFSNIPFIIHNNTLFSIEELLDEPDAWLIDNKTIDYEDLFNDIGYHTINLNLNSYPNISNYLLTLNGYINDRNSAYERISTNTNLPTLSFDIKLRLISFFQNSQFMLGVGDTKYFGELKLFIDENGIARPLRQLLSRKEITDISSIQKFRISEQEYNSLTSDLIKQLIAKNKVFTSFILNISLFDEWSQQFKSATINQYVDDLITIYNWKDETEEILQSKWSDIPWIYTGNQIKFSHSDKIYWSKAFPKMSYERYRDIKHILRSVYQRQLPLKECETLIETFELKTKDCSNTDWTKIRALGTLSANKFLDWLEDDGNHSNFFEEYTLNKKIQDFWTISKISNTQVFDGSNSFLKKYINSNNKLKPLFTELDESLCSDTRNKIGLLQGSELLTAIIETNAFDQNLASFLPSTISYSQLQNFISNLPELKLETDVIYNSSTPEHIIIYQLLRMVEDINAIPVEVQNIIENLRSKIQINQNPLSTYDLSDRIQFGKGDNKKVLNLSNVVAEFKGESDVLDELIESFTSIKEKAKLRKLIFKTRQMDPDEICSKIEAEKAEFYTVHQIVFQLLYEKYFKEKEWTKQHFDNYIKKNIKEGSEEIIQKNYKLFLDIIFDIDLTELTNFYFYDLNLEFCVYKNYAIESEIIPQWLEEWINVDHSQRIEFLSKLGYNGEDSPIVKLRKAIIADNFDPVEIFGYYAGAKPKIQIVWNTIEWLSDFSSQKITENIELIKQINNDVIFNTTELKSVIIPIISDIKSDGTREYILQNVTTGSILYLIQDKEKFCSQIFSAIKKENENTLFIDSSIGITSTHFSVKTVELVENINTECLEKNSVLWDELFYKKWEHYANYPIYIYTGDEIPYIRTFENIIINSFTSDLTVENNGNYYISRILKKDILNNLPAEFPSEISTNLKEWHYKTLQNEALLDEDSFDYNEYIDRLLQDRLGISKEDQKQESGNAKTHAVYFLYENGFDVNNVNNSGAALTNIIAPDGNEIDCIVRSAKGGLLYLNKGHWDMLEDELTYLVAIYPGNTPRLFKDRLELLKEELAENVLFRIPNNRQADEIDGVFDTLESESHLILVTSKKMKEDLFSNLKQFRKFNKNESAAIGSDDYRP